jgi:hypothetical protein
MYIPESAERAIMFEGNVDEVADKIISVVKELGIL